MKVFVSYTSSDSEWAHWIAWQLREAGHEPFVHEWEVGAGENILRWMEERLGEADLLVGVFSDSYCTALYSRVERWAAHWNDPEGRTGFLVPIEVGKVTEWPLLVKPLRRLSLLGLNEADSVGKLIAFLERPEAPTEKPNFPGVRPADHHLVETAPEQSTSFTEGSQSFGGQPPNFLLAALESRGETARAYEAGVERTTLLKLAERLRPNEDLDFDQAVTELSAAVDVAIEVSARGERGTNLDDFVNAVLSRVAEKTRVGDFDGAAQEADAGFAEWQRNEADRREASTRSGVASGTRSRVRSSKAPRQAITASSSRETPLSRSPLQWAAVQNNLGNAFYFLGERESRPEWLRDAVTAYRAALLKRTRERVPLDWAMTQNNLGNALAALGKRESGTKQLEEAVVIYRAALQEYTRERAPFDWAMTQNNLGNALRIIGGRDRGTERLKEAMVAYRAALEVHTRERVPFAWARTQEYVARAFLTMFKCTGERQHLEAALEAVDGTLQEYRNKKFEYRIRIAERLHAEIAAGLSGR